LDTHDSGYEKRKITRKVLADKLGVTAFRISEIVDKKRILERVRLSLKRSGGAIGNRTLRTISAHRNGRP
jgi:plasmid maintenance system antidote protein VapI